MASSAFGISCGGARIGMGQHGCGHELVGDDLRPWNTAVVVVAKNSDVGSCLGGQFSFDGGSALPDWRLPFFDDGRRVVVLFSAMATSISLVPMEGQC